MVTRFVYQFPVKNPQFSIYPSKAEIRGRPHRLSIRSSKQSDFQDFQGYAKPTRLLQATEAKAYKSTAPEKTITFTEDSESQSLYKISLGTSPAFGSGLTNPTSGVLLSIIDDDGNAILQRIPASSHQEQAAISADGDGPDLFHFQRGSLDEFVFQGPKLGRNEAIWISVESGGWRLDGVKLSIINKTGNQPGGFNGNRNEYTKIRYDYEAEDVLVGEGSDNSMVELRPRRLSEYYGIDLFSLLADDDAVGSAPLGENQVISNEESMREYGDLKLSLLLYDAMLIFAGTSVASITTNEKTAYAFLTGGIGGFLYLLLLQRSVDQLPAPELLASGNYRNENGLFRGSVLVVAIACTVFAILAAKRGTVEFEPLLGPKELVAGMIGFLACKLAVLLAAFKPLSVGKND